MLTMPVRVSLNICPAAFPCSPAILPLPPPLQQRKIQSQFHRPLVDPAHECGVAVELDAVALLLAVEEISHIAGLEVLFPSFCAILLYGYFRCLVLISNHEEDAV